MIIIQVYGLSGLGSNSGFWDNFVWPLAVAAVIGVFLLIKQYFIKPRLKSEIKPILKLSIDSGNNISLNSDNDILSKLTLIKQLIRQNQIDGFEVAIKTTYNTNNFDQYQKKELELELKTKAADIKSKFEILLFRPFDICIENSPDVLKIVIEKLLERQTFIVSGRIKLDVYRTDAPKISFPVYLTTEGFETICNNENRTVEEMKEVLRIPQMCAMSIFPNEIMLNEVIPALVNEIYRIRTNFNFDINTKGWDLIMGYEVGLG